MAEREANIAAELARLRDAYLERLPQELNELAELAQRAAGLTGQAVERPQLEALHQRLHKLAGSGGTFGIDALSRQAQALEKTVQGWLVAELDAADTLQRRTFAEGVSALTKILIPNKTPSPDMRTGSAQSPVTNDADQRIHVWLVEDDVPLGETLVRLLGQFGYDVRLFNRIDAAEAAMRQPPPDILIMDVIFTDEGVNATQELLKRPAFQTMGCPILFISAQDDFQSRVGAARLGAEAFLLKPLDVPRLVDRLERALDGRFAAPYRVLIIDDDADLANHFRLVLTAAGMEVAVLNQPEDVVNTVSSFHPELILMDMHMPGYSGSELATVIRHHDEWIGLPIVYLSAETDIDKQLLAMSRGADDFLTKPISDTHLVAAVKVRAARSRQLADLMSKDSLTGLLKHANIKETITLELSRAQRSGKPLSVAMIDIDHFKSVNDTYGHAVGDRVIKAVAHLLKQRLRKGDAIGRYGGEEFVAILPECDQETAQQVLDDIRERFSTLRFHHEEREFTCTLSAGIACNAQHPGASSDGLLIAADDALYVAKHGGRNQVCVADAKRS